MGPDHPITRSPDHPITRSPDRLVLQISESVLSKFSISLFLVSRISRSMMRSYSAQGHPDHDACGTGFIVRLDGRGSHEAVERALSALKKLTHRGGVDADGSSGDGAGLLTAIPRKFIRSAAGELGVALPEHFGLGMLFIRPGEESRVRRGLETLSSEMQLRVPGWREVPVNTSVPGSRAAETLPAVWQCFVAANDGCDQNALESRLFLLRKRAESALRQSAYFVSLSSRTVVYKGLLSPWQLPLFYPDLLSRDFESPFAIFHQRYSTNTRPSWSLAQPFRFVAHNGEINTISANRRWLRAKQSDLIQKLRLPADISLLENGVSDSANFDNSFEILLRRGYQAESAMYTMVPPAWEHDQKFPQQTRSFFQAQAVEHEPWDGPAALIFTDGVKVGAKLDRNGLRPLRYARTADGLIIVGSETGIFDAPENQILERQRLGPGEMLIVDPVAGLFFGPRENLRACGSPAVSLPRVETPTSN